MNKDIRIAVGFLDHPKTIKLRRSLGWEGFEALLRLWCWSAQYRPDGVLLDMTDEDIELAAQWKGEQGVLVAMLVALRFADREECHLVLHDWAEHNGWAAHARERSEKARKAAAAKWEKGKNAEKDAPSNATSNATSNAPSPSPSPNNKKDIVKTEKPASTAALDYGAISRLFGDKCPSLPKPQKMTDARKAAARKLWEQNKDKYLTPELFFSELFQKVEASEFLSGRNGKWGGCCFDWVLNPTNALKILEGNYSGAPQRQETPHLSGRVYVTAEEAEAMERVRREYEQQH